MEPSSVAEYVAEVMGQLQVKIAEAMADLVEGAELITAPEKLGAPGQRHRHRVRPADLPERGVPAVGRVGAAVAVVPAARTA